MRMENALAEMIILAMLHWWELYDGLQHRGSTAGAIAWHCNGTRCYRWRLKNKEPEQ